MTNCIVANDLFQKSNMVVVDVGARYGARGFWEANYRDQIKIIGFEPDVEECARLNNLFAKDKHIYYPSFLFSKACKKTFYIKRHAPSCSFYKSNMSYWKRYPFEPFFEVVKTIEVDAVDFNSVAQENGIKHVDFFKIDVEGAELDVLKGATNFLGKTSILGAMLEVRFLNTSDQPEFSEVDTFMRERGFFLYNMDLCRHAKKALPEGFPRNRDGIIVGRPTKKGQLIWGDALYLRDAVGEMQKASSNDSIWNDTQILKLASLMELFNLNDCSIELLQHSKSKGKLKNIDVETLVNLLTPRFGFRAITYKEYMKNIEKGKWSSDKIETIRPFIHKLERLALALLPNYLIFLLQRLKRILVRLSGKGFHKLNSQ